MAASTHLGCILAFQEEEKQKAESERLQKEAEQRAEEGAGPAPVELGKCSDAKHNEAKWKKEASDDEEEITQEDLEKWKDPLQGGVCVFLYFGGRMED